MNAISKLNEYYQKNNLTPLIYEYTNVGNQWICKCGNINVEASSKSAAKLAVSEILLNNIINTKQKIYCKKYTIILIDGDQRIDCWKWLNTIELINADIHIYVNPASHREKLPNNSTLHVTKSTSRDSVDALILMDYAMYNYKNLLSVKPMTLPEEFIATHKENADIIIISADHILVQAAIDYNSKYCINLESFINILN